MNYPANKHVANIACPSVPSVWPFGYGVILAGFTILEDGSGCYSVRVLPDHLVGKAGATAEQGTWEKAEGAPTLFLTFADTDAVDRMVARLGEMRDAMPVGPQVTA